jgi:hypothetical protein
MDSGVHVQPFLDRDTAFFDKGELLSRGTASEAVQGGTFKGSSHSQH